MIRKLGLVSVLTSVMGLVFVSPGAAFGATTLGTTPATDSGTCAGDTTVLQSISPGAPYTAPSDGVITSWSYRPTVSPPTQIKLKVGHPAPGADLTMGAADFTIVGESRLETPIANTLNTFPTRVLVHAGDDIGLYLSNDGECRRADASYTNHFNNQDVLPGTTQTFLAEKDQLSVSAILEPDADHDGFGDETQDQCLGQAGTSNGCPAPAPAAGPSQPAPVAKKKCKKHKHRSASAAKKHCKKKK